MAGIETAEGDSKDGQEFADGYQSGLGWTKLAAGEDVERLKENCRADG